MCMRSYPCSHRRILSYMRSLPRNNRYVPQLFWGHVLIHFTVPGAPDFVMCECCFGWQHLQCIIELNMLENDEIARILRQDPTYTFYCEVCSNKNVSLSVVYCIVQFLDDLQIPIKWCGKLLDHELPVQWTCERRKRKSGRAINKEDWCIMARS